MLVDMLTFSHPINSEVSTDNDIGQMFDSITYDKGRFLFKSLLAQDEIFDLYLTYL